MNRFAAFGALLLAALVSAPSAMARTFYEARLNVALYYSNIQNEEAHKLGELDGLLLASNDGKFGTFMIGGVEYPATIGEFSIGEDYKIRVKLTMPKTQMKSLIDNLAKREGKSAIRERALTLANRYFEAGKGSVTSETFNIAQCYASCYYFSGESTLFQFHDDLSAESLHVQFEFAKKGKIRGAPGRRGD